MLFWLMRFSQSSAVSTAERSEEWATCTCAASTIRIGARSTSVAMPSSSESVQPEAMADSQALYHFP